MPRDLKTAVDRAAKLHGEQWFVDMTRDAVGLFEDELDALIRPDETVALAVSAPVDEDKARPGLLVVVEQSPRYVVLWATGLFGRKKLHESYPYGSVPCELVRTRVRGIPNEVWVLQLGSRRIVMPSQQLGTTLRDAFVTGSVPL
jgi:hypothetical protein